MIRNWNKAITVLLAILCLGTADMQAKSKISDFIKDGTIWLGKTSEKATDFIQTTDQCESLYYPKPYRMICGTTIINGVEYMRLCGGILLCNDKDQYLFEDENPDIPAIKDMITGCDFGNLIALIRIEEGKMYVYNMRRANDNDEEEFLYYDFDMEEGDVRELGCQGFYSTFVLSRGQQNVDKWEVKCIGKGSVTSCGNTFDLLYLDYKGVLGAYWEQPMFCMLDCIGTSSIYPNDMRIRMFSGAENIPIAWEANPMMYPGLSLETMICDGKIVFKGSDFNEDNIVKPDFKNAEVLETNGDKAISPIYSIDGTSTDATTPGIKISNGKKYIKTSR